MKTQLKNKSTRRNLTEADFASILEYKENIPTLKNTHIAALTGFSSMVVGKVLKAGTWDAYCQQKSEAAQVYKAKCAPSAKVVDDSTAVEVWRTKMDKLCTCIDRLCTKIDNALIAKDVSISTVANEVRGNGVYR